jgi:hypothetical protein
MLMIPARREYTSGICILISALVISTALIFSAISNRYSIEQRGNSLYAEKYIFDKLTGRYWYMNLKGDIYRVDLKNAVNDPIKYGSKK